MYEGKILNISKRRLTWAAWASALFSAAVMLQVLLILVRGEPFCLNTGCRVVEELVVLNPITFNILGALFFAACAVTAMLAGKRPVFLSFFLFLCLSGLAAEGVLLGYQAFVARTFCSYCLSVLAAVFVLNLLAGTKQALAGAGILIVELLLFSLLNFNISTAGIKDMTLENGTCAITRCQDPARTLYLIFSQDCPHCHKVLDALSGCSMCEFHFNPVKKIKADLLPGTVYRENYIPEINRLALKILGIDSIPVLIVKTEEGYLLIKGDREIINFIRNNCFFRAAPMDNNGRPLPESLFAPVDPMTSGTTGGACSLEQECSE